MPLPQFSKDKSARVDWGYYRRKSGLIRTRNLLWVLAALLVVAPLVAATVLGAVRDEPIAPLAAVASRGPVSSPHAAWDNQCEACHEPFHPIGGDQWLPRFLGTASNNKDATHASTASKCETCHAGPPHHPNMRADKSSGCSDCHRDHRGRDASLVRLADSDCVRCHRDLGPYHNTPNDIKTVKSITGFATPDGHPEFRPVNANTDAEKHRRTVKFSHAVHMMPGLGSAKSFKFSSIPDDAERARYMALLGKANSNDIVELNCAACHQLDASRTDGAVGIQSQAEQFAAKTRPLLTGLPKEAMQPPRAEGAYFLPINFEAACKACHPLTFDEATPGLIGRQVPHRWQPDALEQYLQEAYSAKYIADKLKPVNPPDRGPGRLDPRLDDLNPDQKKLARDAIDKQVHAAKQTLFVGQKTCQECHYQEFAHDDAGRITGEFPTRIVPGNIPTIWMSRAKYNHAAHRAMACNECHPGAYRNVDQERKAAKEYAASDMTVPHYQHPPDLPKLNSCQVCHSPARTDGDRQVGGVRHGCTDCHTYHHVDRRLQGQGSPWRDPITRSGLDDLLGKRVPRENRP